ncbi:hypothetical protein [Lactobacillus plantarum] [Lactiplantibacillus mudanjiangensis]|nr:hypothetical protein [Lactobacillus plantarum] [Lactiplantibacillus mudanjiangensis]
MKKVPRRPFEIWLKSQNTHDRVQPVTGTKLENKQNILCIYHTLKPTLWQRLKGWK